MDELKPIQPNQGTPKRRAVYNLLKANPELADQLLKLFEDTYDQLMDGYIKITMDFAKDKPNEVKSLISDIQDHLCITMEEDMGWINLKALNYETIKNNEDGLPTEEQRESWIRELSKIEESYWDTVTTETGKKLVQYDALGNPTGEEEALNEGDALVDLGY